MDTKYLCPLWGKSSHELGRSFFSLAQHFPASFCRPTISAGVTLTVLSFFTLLLMLCITSTDHSPNIQRERVKCLRTRTSLQKAWL